MNDATHTAALAQVPPASATGYDTEPDPRLARALDDLQAAAQENTRLRELLAKCWPIVQAAPAFGTAAREETDALQAELARALQP